MQQYGRGKGMTESPDDLTQPENTSQQPDRSPSKSDKRDAVEKDDLEGSAHVSDDRLNSPEEATVSLTADVSADVATTVEEFMDQAAQQNEAAADAVPDV